MKKAHHFASNAVPLLARILLCLAFIPAGWHHAMNWTQFQGAEAERLRQLALQLPPSQRPRRWLACAELAPTALGKWQRGRWRTWLMQQPITNP